ncbi:MAG: glycosyltransferase family 4 protein [Pseudomonadota bacterium]
MAGNITLRIVHIMRAPMGGVFRHVRDLALQHTQAGHQVGIICDVAGTDGYQEAGLEQLDVHLALGVHRVAMPRAVGAADVLSARKVLTVLKSMNADVVHGHGAKGGVYARAVGRMAGGGRNVARIYSPHGGSLHFDPASKAGKIYFAVERMLERQTDAIMYVAEFERDAYRRKVGEPRCATHIVYNGLAKNEFAPVKPVKGAADFLFIGEMRDLKGYDLVIHASKALIDKGYASLKVLMVGSGPEEKQADRLIADHGLASIIERRAPMPARDAFALARCVVMPSRAEAMPYIVLEALGATMPIIASSVGGIPEIFAGTDVALIEPDTDPLEETMRSFLDDPARLAAQMPSPALLKSRFSAEVMGESVMNAYRSALSA